MTIEDYSSLNGTTLLNQNITTNLTYQHKYKVTCSAVNSRPSVGLGIFGDNINFEKLSNVTAIMLLPESISTIQSDSLSNTTLVYNITFNDPSLVSINTLRCDTSAGSFLLLNNLHYLLNKTYVFDVKLNVPSGNLILFPQISIAQLSGSNITFFCLANDSSPIWNYYSLDGTQMFQINNSQPNI